MKKMRKMVSLALTAAMTAGLMTGMGALTASADSERTKITALLKGTESTEQFQTFDYLLKNFCDEKGLDYEIELVNDMQDYFTKLQMYINSDTLPDIFGQSGYPPCVSFSLSFLSLRSICSSRCSALFLGGSLLSSVPGVAFRTQ